MFEYIICKHSVHIYNIIYTTYIELVYIFVYLYMDIHKNRNITENSTLPRSLYVILTTFQAYIRQC